MNLTIFIFLDNIFPKKQQTSTTMANIQQNGEFEYRETFNMQKMMRQWEGIAQSNDDFCPINPTIRKRRTSSSSTQSSGSEKCPVNYNGTNGNGIDISTLKQNLTNMMGNGSGDPGQQELIVQVMTKLLAAQMHSNPPTDPAEREAAQALCPFMNGGELPSGYLTPSSLGSTTPSLDRSVSPPPDEVPHRTSSPAPSQPEGPPAAIPPTLNKQFSSLDEGTRSKSMTDLAAMDNQGMGPRRRSSLALARARANGSHAGSRRGSAANSRRNSVESCASDVGCAKTGKEPVKLMYYVDDKATVDTLHVKAAEVSIHNDKICETYFM